jgi:hypothetical protein
MYDNSELPIYHTAFERQRPAIILDAQKIAQNVLSKLADNEAQTATPVKEAVADLKDDESRLSEIRDAIDIHFAVQEINPVEAAAGGRLFGDIPEGTQRQFYCIDQKTWYWREITIQQDITTIYQIEPERVKKIQNGQTAQINKGEIANLLSATQRYYEQVYPEAA